ncbi:MAG: membrane protein insertion efficiency factor YidD [Acidobacteria bacterium]|nr:membrane protein insertion efficiency factor YidD [Acidobacteriota bacterium]
MKPAVILPVRVLPRLVILVLVGATLFDVTRPPAEQVSVRVAVAGIVLYQSTLSPLMGSAGVACRFTPSCSRYAVAVITRDGILRGTWRAARRIVRCGPWTPRGTVDNP